MKSRNKSTASYLRSSAEANLFDMSSNVLGATVVVNRAWCFVWIPQITLLSIGHNKTPKVITDYSFMKRFSRVPFFGWCGCFFLSCSCWCVPCHSKTKIIKYKLVILLSTSLIKQVWFLSACQLYSISAFEVIFCFSTDSTVLKNNAITAIGYSLLNTRE